MAQLKFKQTWQTKFSFKTLNKILPPILSIILLCHIFHFLNLKDYYQGRTYRYWSVREDGNNPVQSIRILKENNITGNIFNDDHFGGYLLWSSYPDLNPFIDNRNLDYSLFDIYHALRRHPQKVWPIMDAQYQFDIILLDAGKKVSQKMIRYFIQHADWQLIHVEGTRVLFLKKGVIPFPKKLQTFEAELTAKDSRLKQLISQADNFPSQAPPNIRDTIFQFIAPSYEYIEPLETGVTLFDLGYKSAGLEKVLESMQISDDYYSTDILSRILSNLSNP